MKVCEPEVHNPTSCGDWVILGLILLSIFFMFCYVIGKVQ